MKTLSYFASYWRRLEPEREIVDQRRCLRIAAYILFYLGVWCDGWLPRLQLCRAVYAMVTQAVTTPQFVHDKKMLVEHIMMSVLSFTSFVTMYTLTVHQARIRQMFESLDRLQLPVYVSSGGARILRRADAACWWFAVLDSLSNVTLTTAAILANIPDMIRDRRIAFCHWHPYDVHKSPMFELTMATTVLTTPLDFYFLCVSDIVFVSITIQIVSQFKFLNYTLENIRGIVEATLKKRRQEEDLEYMTTQSQMFDVSSETRSSRSQTSDAHQSEVAEHTRQMEFSSEMEKCLHSLVTLHQTVIGLAAELTEVYGLIMAKQLIVTLLLCVFGIYISTIGKLGAAISTVAICVCATLTQLLLFCWSSDELTTESVRVCQAAYACDWLDTSESFKRSLRIIMSRSQKSVYIRAAGLPLSRRTFKLVTKSAHYLYSFLQGGIIRLPHAKQ